MNIKATDYLKVFFVFIATGCIINICVAEPVSDNSQKEALDFEKYIIWPIEHVMSIKRDPFTKFTPPKKVKEKVKVDEAKPKKEKQEEQIVQYNIKDMELEATLTLPHTVSWALISHPKKNFIVKEDDIIGAYTVISIDRQFIVLKGPEDKKIVLEMDTHKRDKELLKKVKDKKIEKHNEEKEPIPLEE